MNILLNFLYPQRCLSCGKLGKYICDHCVSMIQFIDADLCPVCRKPAIDGKTHPRCQTKYSLDGLTSFFKYKDPIRETIKRIKYKPFAFDVSKTLVFLALKNINQKSFFQQVIKEKPILVPIPLHHSRERARGFNQAEVLGKILAEKWDLQFIPNLLIRTRKTQPQYKLKGKERKENLKKAFNINPNYPIIPTESRGSSTQGVGTNYSVILFDDLWTTGTTMRVCGNLLKRAGAKFVWGLTMAR